MYTKSKLETLFSILSLSAVSGITILITGTIPQLKAEFPAVSIIVIESLVTIANLSTLSTIIVNPWLSKKFGLKPVVITGLLIGGLAGIIPAIYMTFTTIFLSRIILGIGVGLFSPHAISLIVHTYSGSTRTKLLGYQTGLGALGNAILLGLAGLLINIKWVYVFWIHGVLLIIAVLIAKFVNEPSVTREKIINSNKSVKLPKANWILLCLAFITYLLIWGVQLKLPSYFEYKSFGSPQIVNLTLALMNIGGLLAGLSFGYIYSKIKKLILPIGYAGAGLSIFILMRTSQANIAILAAILFNFIYSYTGPYIVYKSNAMLSNDQINKVNSYLTGTTIITAFIAPIFWNTIGKIGVGSLFNNIFSWITGLLGILTMLTYIYYLIESRKFNHGRE